MVTITNLPLWWNDLPSICPARDFAALRDAARAAGISRNDRTNIEKIWTLMLMRKLGNKKEGK